MDIFLTWKPRQGATYEVAVTGVGVCLKQKKRQHSFEVALISLKTVLYFHNRILNTPWWYYNLCLSTCVLSKNHIPSCSMPYLPKQPLNPKVATAIVFNKSSLNMCIVFGRLYLFMKSE